MANPLWIAQSPSESPCAMHGGTCACPDVCRQMKAASVEPAAAPACHASGSEVTEPDKDAAPDTAATCHLSAACGSESNLAVVRHAYRFLPESRVVWMYAPGTPENLAQETIRLRAGFPPTPFHPPEASRDS